MAWVMKFAQFWVQRGAQEQSGDSVSHEFLRGRPEKYPSAALRSAQTRIKDYSSLRVELRLFDDRIGIGESPVAWTISSSIENMN